MTERPGSGQSSRDPLPAVSPSSATFSVQCSKGKGVAEQALFPHNCSTTWGLEWGFRGGKGAARTIFHHGQPWFPAAAASAAKGRPGACRSLQWVEAWLSWEQLSPPPTPKRGTGGRQKQPHPLPGACPAQLGLAQAPWGPPGWPPAHPGHSQLPPPPLSGAAFACPGFSGPDPGRASQLAPLQEAGRAVIVNHYPAGLFNWGHKGLGELGEWRRKQPLFGESNPGTAAPQGSRPPQPTPPGA